ATVEFSDIDDLIVGQVDVPVGRANNITYVLTTGIVTNGGDVALRAATLTAPAGVDLLRLNQPIDTRNATDTVRGDVRLVVVTAPAAGRVAVMQVAVGVILADELGIRARGDVTLAFADNDVNALAVAIETGTTARVEFRDIDDLR